MISCKSTKVENPIEYQNKMLVFSHGGGFTGGMKTYYFLENGQVFKNESNAIVSEDSLKVYEVLKNIPKGAVEQIFSNYEILAIEKINRNTPGNLNYTIQYIDKETQHEVQWGKGQDGVKSLDLFYGNVLNLIKKYSEE